MPSTELIMSSWKQEPLSPPSEETTWISSSDDDLFYSILEQDADFKLESDQVSSSYETKAEVASHILENLENLIDLDDLIKEEPFFLDVKMLPVLEEMEHIRYHQTVKLDTTNEFINEFDSVPLCDVIQYTPTPATLTPPQSPPSDQPMLTTLKPLVTNIFNVFQDVQQEENTEKQLLDNALVYSDIVTTPPQPDIAHELSIVDELVRSRVENMQWRSSPSSPCSSNSNSSFDDSSTSSDPEWMPESTNETPSDFVKTPSTTSRNKRKKPYSRNIEDKRSRKKEQNKNAATRYRMKKKAEVEEILSEEKKLMDEGQKLNNKITEIQREIKYLKGLMRDLFKAKGLIN